MDTLRDFLTAKCLRNPDAEVTSAVLYTAYRDWCRENEEQPMSQKDLGMRLRERGFTQARSGGKRGWRGLGVVEGMTDDGK
jgi:putative DNA primase/helicase